MQEILEFLESLSHNSESEIIELKEAKSSFRTKDLGRYFSALSNEANLKGVAHALIVFGVADDGTVCGTSFMQEASTPSKGLMRLKKAVANETNNRITFSDILETEYQGKRVIVFVVPAATRGVPTQWAGAAWAREGDSLVPLPLNKVDEIRAQPPHDWSRQIVEDATMDDLDPGAIRRAKEKFREKYGDREGLVDGLEDAELLDKAGITYRGRITNAALLLLGRADRANAIVGALPKISWTLYEQDGSIRTYQHFGPPFLLTIDDVGSKIRNEERRILADADTLLPTTVDEYDQWSIRELIGNAIAHQAYDRGGKINVEEFPDRLVFINEGSFIPGTLEAALRVGYKPPYYRNPFLVEAMLNVGMLDQNAMGIRTVCRNARDRYMPLPTYWLDEPERVRVELPNHEINRNYTLVLHAMPDLPIQTVLSLDKVQKRIPLSPQELEDVDERGLVEKGPDGLRIVEPTPSKSAMKPQKAAPSGGSGSAGAEGRVTAPLKPGGYRRRISPEERNGLKSEIVSILSAHGRGLSRNAITAELQGVLTAKGYADAGRIDGETVYGMLKELAKERRVEAEGATRSRIWRLP